MEKILIIILVLMQLSGCIRHIPVKAQQSDDAIYFDIEQHGIIFKTNIPVTCAAVFKIDIGDVNKAKPLWEFCAPEMSSYFLTNPQHIKYGVTPNGYIEKVNPKELQHNEIYQFRFHGPGNAGGVKFTYSTKTTPNK